MITQATRLENVVLSTDIRQRVRGTVLAVDEGRFTQLVDWRDDLNSIDLPEWTTEIPQSGRELPVMSQSIGLWLRYEGESRISFASTEIMYGALPTRLAAVFDISLRLRDAAGRMHVLPLQTDASKVMSLFEGLEDVEATAEKLRELQETGWPDDGWLYFEGSLDALESAPQGALKLEGINVNPDNRYMSERGW